ncbi:hypothetical protein MRX96_052863 [Rhipicephalus microplus]
MQGPGWNPVGSQTRHSTQSSTDVITFFIHPSPILDDAPELRCYLGVMWGRCCGGGSVVAALWWRFCGGGSVISRISGFLSGGQLLADLGSWDVVWASPAFLGQATCATTSPAS